MMTHKHLSIAIVLLSCSFKESGGVFAFYERNINTRYLESSSALTVNSATECCLQCVKNQNCRIANYHRTNNICEIGIRPSIKDVYLSNVAGWDMMTLKGECATGWTKHRTSCYMLSTKLQSWDNAQTECGLLYSGGHLADVHSGAINDLLKVLYDQVNEDLYHYIWVGGYRDSGGVFRWTDHSRVQDSYQNWKAGQPDFHMASEYCMHVQAENNYLWNDEECAYDSLAFCEY